jgi:ATP-dependent helicase/nuclease subunit A
MVLDRLGLSDDQKTIVKQIEHDLLVSAGAGTGKTRTLVARYLWLLDLGYSPRQVLAITFTEKAAREMRNRLRQAIGTQVQEASSDELRSKWIELEAVMDAARIGTIHSFCAEVLRSHPAEAAIDPMFTVVDEGMAATIKAQVVDTYFAPGNTDPPHEPSAGGNTSARRCFRGPPPRRASRGVGCIRAAPAGARRR